MWLERKRFPALQLGPDEGIIAITSGVKADDLGGQKEGRCCIIQSSTNRRCEYAWKRPDLSTSHRFGNHKAMVAASSRPLGSQLALDGYKPKRS
jgi:hypothetical protein